MPYQLFLPPWFINFLLWHLLSDISVYLHMKLPSKEEWFLRFFTKQYWAFLSLKVSLNILASHAIVFLGHKLPNLVSTNQLRKKGAVRQEVLRKLKLLTDFKTDPTFRITWGTYIKKWQTSTSGQNRATVIRFTLSPKTNPEKIKVTVVNQQTLGSGGL